MQHLKHRTCALLILASGLACGASWAKLAEPAVASFRDAEVLRPTSVQPILGVRTDGSLMLGDVVSMPDQASAADRGSFAIDVYDSTGGSSCGDLCGGLDSPSSRYFFGVSAVAWVDDVEFNAATVLGNPNFEGVRIPVGFPACDPSGLEPLIMITTIFDSPVTGFDTDGDGQVDSPYSRTDSDNDGLVDEFSAGFVATYANVDTDGDTTNGNEVLDVQSGGIYLLFAENLTDTNGDGIPGDIDLGGFPSGDNDGDGQPDGALEVFYAGSEGPDTDGDGFPDSGTIYNAFEPSGLSPQPAFWGTPNADNSGCAAANGITQGSSGGTLWQQSESLCAPGSGMVSNVWDPSTDLTDLTGVVACPDPLTPSVAILGAGSVGCSPACADTNGDCVLTPADFNAWIIAYNSQSFACDQNGDGLCTPADFNAWVLNFNTGGPCP